MTIAPIITRFIPPYLPKKESYVPTHPELFLIHFGSEHDFSSSLVTQRAFTAGEVLTPIAGTTGGIKKYSSVQVLPDPPLPGAAEGDARKPRHIELQSDLLYVNHSCDPSVMFEVPASGEWVVRALKDIPKGEILTFAYFTTEWDMDQPFHCLCGTSRCIGEVTGAKYLPAHVLAKYQLNDHIKALKAHQVAEAANGKSGVAAADL